MVTRRSVIGSAPVVAMGFAATAAGAAPAAVVGATALTQGSVGLAYRPRSGAEQRAAVTVADYAYTWGDIRRYGANGDGKADNHAAIVAALAANKVVYLPAPEVGYLVGTGTISVPANAQLVGDNKRHTRLLHGCQQDMFALADGSGLINLTLDGNAPQYGGRGLVIKGRDGRQVVEHCRIINFDGYCVEFEDSTAGSQSTFHDCEIWRLGGDQPGRYAIKNQDQDQLLAVPRKFSQIESGGKKFFDLGGTNNVLVTNSFLGDVLFSPRSRGVIISGCRLGVNESMLHIAGFNNVISGCDIAPQITLEPGAGECTLAANTFNRNPAVIDNSGCGGRNLVDMPATPFVPQIASSDGSATLGDGKARGVYSRSGAMIHLAVEIDVGESTHFGDGELQITIPVPPVLASGGIKEHLGMAYCHQQSSRASTLALCSAQVGAPHLRMLSMDASGPVNANRPFRWSTGDFLRLSIDYVI